MKAFWDSPWSKIVLLSALAFLITLYFAGAFDKPRHERLTLSGSRAWCVGKIERIKVVHWIPGNLRKTVKFEDSDPAFEKLASKVLKTFWTGEITKVVTNNYAPLIPLSEREISLIFFQRETGEWRASAYLFNKKRLDGLFIQASYASDPLNFAPGDGSVGFKNSLGRFDAYDNNSFELLERSLQDLVRGRCDRSMSHAVTGSMLHYVDLQGAGLIK
jgi:hypothetical protein